MGTPSYATEIFKKLINTPNIEVVALFTQPDKKVGRKQILTPPNIKRFVIKEELNIPIFQPESLREQNIIEKINSFSVDFIIVSAYGKILPKEILEIAPCINLHASILPKYRGASPIQEAILHQDRYTGVTAMKMEEGLDTGDILAYSFVPCEDMKAPELFDKLSILASNLTIKVLQNYDKIKPTPQIDADASYCKKIKKSDGVVSFKDSSEIYAKFKAFYFWPKINLENGVKLIEVREIENSSKNREGEILEIEKESIIVGCKKGSIEIFRVQPPSKKEMSVLDYIRGKRYKKGDIFI